MAPGDSGFAGDVFDAGLRGFAVSLREPLIRIARTRPPSTLPRPHPDRLARHVGKRATDEDRTPESNKAERHGHGRNVPGDRGQQLSDPASILVLRH